MAIQEMIENPELRARIGERARRHIVHDWSPVEVAKRFARVLSGDIPPEWMFDPDAIDYVHGGGVHEDRLREVVRAIVAAKGMAALQLSDKPKLLAKLHELIAKAAPQARRDAPAPAVEGSCRSADRRS